MNRIIIFSLMIIGWVNQINAQQQTCDCPNPILFVHGINSDNTTWDKTTVVLQSVYGTPQVLSFNLNSSLNSNLYSDDVTWVPSTFQVVNKCLYTINFNTTNYSNTYSQSNESAIVKQGYALKLAIESIILATGKNKVVLVGHSMGGLASRDYLQRWANPNNHHVAKLLTLGTPHLGANIAQVTGVPNFFGFLNNRESEAARDLAVNTRIIQNNDLVDVPGYYLFGGNENLDQYLANTGDIPFAFHNADINADGDELDNIIGINVGTTFNPAMPLPPDVKYTYYVSNVVGIAGDGAVDDMQAWLYKNGNDIGDGSTADYNSGKNISVPWDGVDHRRSDRISKSGIAHVALPLIEGQTEDYKGVIQGIDEGDFPFYAQQINIGSAYIGVSQKRADKVADSSNIALVGALSTHDPNIDTDWFKFTANTTHNGNYKLLVNKVKGSYFRAEVFATVPPMLVNRLAGASISLNSNQFNNDQILLDLGTLTPGEYWIRMTSKVDDVPEGLNTYSFRVFDPSICIKPSLSIIEQICDFSSYDLVFNISGDLGVIYDVSIPTLGYTTKVINCGIPQVLSSLEQKAPLQIFVSNTLNNANVCKDTLTILPDMLRCDPSDLTICAVDDKYLNFIPKSLKSLFCDKVLCDVVPASNPLAQSPLTAMSVSSDLPSSIKFNLQKLYVNYIQEEASFGKLVSYYGSLAVNENINQLEDVFSSFFDSIKHINTSDSLQIQKELKEFDIETNKVERLIVKWNNSVIAWNNNVYIPNSTYPYIMNKNVIDSFQNLIINASIYSQNNGFANTDSMYSISINNLANYSLDKDPTVNAVCASVAISLSQKLTMTREAFEGTLKIFNGNTSVAMDSIKVDLVIRNESGVISNDLFQIDNTSLDKITGINGAGSIAANAEGVATIQFIPEKEAAPISPRFYSFGGRISYIDPFSGFKVTMPLTPVTLQVNPSPDLYLHYFMQRDVLGDDAFTPRVEPSEPARLGVMIENSGFGVAQNVRIQSAQPQVIDNEKGLALGMSLIGSKLQGNATNWGLTNIDFGNIEARKTKVGEWLFSSNLLGHFTGYSTNVRHISSRGNSDLSLVRGATLHELIHSIKIYGQEDDGILDFLVNEVQDANDHPDAIFATKGNTVYNVVEATSGQFLNPILFPTFTNVLQVTPQDSGWNYLKLADPGNGDYTITSVTRNSDNQVIPLENAWLTYVTIPDSRVQRYENRFHLVDLLPSANTVSYTVVWSPKDQNPLAVDTILNVPKQVVSVPVVSLDVVFNKPIEESTFTIADLTLSRQGGSNLIDGSVLITKLDSLTYRVILTGLTSQSGNYTFTIQAAGVLDKVGMPGLFGRQVSWIQNVGGLIVTEVQGISAGKTYSSIDSLIVKFNLPIDTSTIKINTLSLMRMGELGSSPVQYELTDNTFKTIKIKNINLLSTSDGSYSFSILMGDIRTTSGVSGSDTFKLKYFIDSIGPKVDSLVLLSVGGLDRQHRTGVQIHFSEAISLFDNNKVSLYKNGNQILPIESIAKIGSKIYKVNFGVSTLSEGHYKLIVKTSFISDSLGNYGIGLDTIEWEVKKSTSLLFSNISISPDLGFSSTDRITSLKQLALNFEINEIANNIQLTMVDNGIAIQLKDTVQLTLGSHSIAINMLYGGSLALKISADDVFGNRVDTLFAVMVDEVDLTGQWLFQDNQTLLSHPDSVYFRFSSRVSTSFPQSSQFLEFKQNNQNIVHNLNGTLVGGDSLLITGLRNLTKTQGNYQLGIKLPSFEKYLSGKSGSKTIQLNWIIPDLNRAPIANAGVDTFVNQIGSVVLNAGKSFDPDGDTITFQWIPLSGVPLLTINKDTTSFRVTPSMIGSIQSFMLVVSDGFKSSSDIVRVYIERINSNNIFAFKAILQGPYDAISDTMSTALQQQGFIPLKSPYNTLDSVLTYASIPNNVVDWVLVEIVDPQAPSTIFQKQSAFLKSNGDIVNISNLPLTFSNIGQDTVSIRIKHRNHLSIRTRPLSLAFGSSTMIDFRSDTSPIHTVYNLPISVFNNGQPRYLASNGKYALWAGDVNGDTEVKYQGSNNDRGVILSALGGSNITNTINGYYSADVNLNGQVKYQGSNNDRGIILQNIGGVDITKVLRVHDVGSIGVLDCPSSTITGSLISGIPASGVSAAMLYTGGNGGTHAGQSVTSTGVTGLTATLAAGTFATGAGILTYTITGTPASTGTALFAFNIGGQMCTLSITVAAAGGVYPAGTVHCNPSSPTAVVDVTNPTTGKTWMDRNLGASQVATSSTDAASYGDLYQWGRRADGHQCRNSATTSTLSSIDQPAHGSFITTSSGNYDWRDPQNTNLWQGVNGVNNPCPNGYRVPTETEFNVERLSWGSNTSEGAYNSQLKFPKAGHRSNVGPIYNVGSSGYYWSSTANSGIPIELGFSNSSAGMDGFYPVHGFSIRCIKD